MTFYFIESGIFQLDSREGRNVFLFLDGRELDEEWNGIF